MRRTDQFSVSSGTLTLSGTTGLAVTAGANASAAMTVQGTLANINAAFNGLTYVSTQYFNGTDTLTLVSNDLGNSGVGGPLTATSTVNIAVSHTNLPPVVRAGRQTRPMPHAAGLLPQATATPSASAMPTAAAAANRSASASIKGR